MHDLEHRLTDLGQHLDLDEADLIADVMVRLDEPSPEAGPRWSGLRVAALVLVALAIALAAIPGSRRTVAGWLGLDGVTIERRPDLTVPAGSVPSAPAGSAPAGSSNVPASTIGTGVEPGLPGPGDSRAVTVDGRQVLVSAISGRLNEGLIAKTVGATTPVEEVDIGGARGIWIGGGPHEVYFETGDGVVVERVAGPTLLWQVGSVVYRVEGFDRLQDARAFALGTG